MSARIEMNARIEKVGRTSFAFGLQWISANAEDAQDVLADLEDHAGAVHYVMQGGNRKGLFSGLRRAPKNSGSTSASIGVYNGPLKGRVASYAATLAQVAKDGLYICRVDDNQWWYCTISDGLVGGSTDCILSPVQVRENAGQREQAFEGGMIFADEHCLPDVLLDFPNALVFDPVRAIASAKPAWLKKRGTSTAETVAAVVIAVAALAGFWWAYQTLFPKPPIASGPTPEEIREMYLSSLRAVAPALPATQEWASDAFQASRSEIPAYRAGWSLETVTCVPRDGCSGSYAPAPGGLWYSHEGLQVKSVPTPVASRSVAVGVPLLQPTDDELLYSHPSYGRPLGEIVGTFGLRFASVQMLAAPQVNDLSSMTGTTIPEGAVPLMAEHIVVGKASVLDAFLLRKVTAYFSQEGFRPSSLAYTHGYGTQTSSWRIEFVRIRSDY